MKKTASIIIMIILLSVSTICGLREVGFAAANPEGEFPSLAMPIEHVNYTITSIDGVLWAVIDGNYPISLLSQPSCTFGGDLPMVYPMPPGATDIHVYLDNRELSWVNYTSQYPESLHHTAIGNWGMIYCTLSNVSSDFLLEIHYEHPLESVNGSYLFLYDLNISPYLSQKSNNSTCYYTIRMEANTTNIHSFTTESDAHWNPINYTIKAEGENQVISVQEYSEYGKPLPGDFVFQFSNTDQVPEITFEFAFVLMLVICGFLLIFLKVKKESLVKRPINKKY